MPVSREAIIEWNDEEYTVVPSMRLMRSIELEGISLMAVGAMTAANKPQPSLIAFIIGTVMRSAGCPVTDEDLCAEIMRGDVIKVMSLYGQVLEAISPEAPEQKKPDAPKPPRRQSTKTKAK